jgi:Hemerythrin HHE cation binding domain
MDATAGTAARGATMSDSATIHPDTSDMPAVHAVFRSSIALGPDYIGSAAGDDERRALIANYYANLMSFLEVHHDGEEALVFPLLIERAPEYRSLIEGAAGQHADVLGLMRAVRQSIGSWEENGDSEAPDLVRALHDLDDFLTPHLDQEEEAILPLAAQYLSVEEWGMLPGHAMRSFNGDKIWLILGLIRENFTQAQRDNMLEHMPPPARQMWETMGETSFIDLMVQLRHHDQTRSKGSA